MIIRDYEVLFHFMFSLSRLGIYNSIVASIEEDDGPYFALSKSERYVNKLKKGIYSGLDNT